MLAAAIAVFVAAVALLLLQVDPVPTWFYVFAWYPTLVILDEVSHRLGQPRLLRRPALVASIFGWSVVIWLVFELANFRLDNWYYIFLPRNAVERWAGITLSFATVVPAIVFAERTLRAAGIGHRWQTKPVITRPADRAGALLLGVLQLALALIWPRIFFPLIWGAAFLLAEPYVYRRRPDLSLFADLERGQWGRTARLLIGGLGIGLLWESYNYWARGKWVYTVPSLEGTKWFEMPPFGFVGFAFFALEAWSMYQALCAAGVAIPADQTPALKAGRAIPAALAAAAFSVLVLFGMERWTVSSVVPETLASAPEHQLEWFKGVGTVHAAELRAAGITSVCDLRNQDPQALWARIHGAMATKRPTQAEVRVWIEAAGRKCPQGKREAGSGKGKTLPTAFRGSAPPCTNPR